MTDADRRRALARGRATAKRNRAAAARRRAREHRAATRAWAKARSDYYRVLVEYGEGSRQEKRAFRKLITAEGAWFRTHPAS